MPEPAAEFRRLLSDPATQREIRAFTRKVLKLRSNQCAATASEYLRRAGYITHVRTWTADLAAALDAAGWIRKTGTPEPYSVVFTKDDNGNGAPDHVYTLLEMIDPALGVAEVIDNYEPGPHLRNVHGAVTYNGQRLARGRAAFYMVPPEENKAFTLEEIESIRSGFAVQYASKHVLTQDEQRMLNLVRAGFRRAGVT